MYLERGNHATKQSSTITIPSIPPTTNRHPIVDILCLISVEIVFDSLSNVRLLLGIVIRPRADASLWLYWLPMLRKICNALLEFSRNNNLTIKYLKIMVDREYSYGLPRFLLGGMLGHDIQPIVYKMLKSVDSLNLLTANLWNRCSQNNIPEIIFKLL